MSKTTTIEISSEAKEILDRSIQTIQDYTSVRKMSYSEYIGKIILKFGQMFETGEILHYAPFQNYDPLRLTKDEEDELLKIIDEKLAAKRRK